jgi:hypothetical protein
VDEVHVLAPFMDREATALRDLALALQPSQLHVYVADTVSVDGDSIRNVLASLATDVHLWSFQPDEFVHAKLIGVIAGHRGRLLSGSANLSRAAFTSSRSTDTWANIEAGVVCELPAEVIRGYFRPPGLGVEKADLARLSVLEYKDPLTAPAYPYRLYSARRRPDGRIEVKADPSPPSDRSVYLGLLDSSWTLAGDVTEDAVPVDAGGVIVLLCDGEGHALSSPVALDDPEALAAALRDQRARSDRPTELDLRDVETPVGAMLQRLHQACIFDVDETAAVTTAQRSATADDTTEADPGFWDKLLQEELALDRRSAAYRRFGSPALPIDDDEILQLLRQMLNRTPQERVLGAPGPEGEGPPPEEPPKPGIPWTPAQRLQLRLANVLQRWSRATNDPRLRWVNPLAPARNFAALIGALAECWEEQFLTERKIRPIIRLLFEAFITSEDIPGYLVSIPTEQQVAAQERLPDEARSAASALLYSALRPDSMWREDIFEWQTFMVPGIELGIFQAQTGTDALVRRLIGANVAPKEIDDRLVMLADYVDDPQWCLRLAKELDLARVGFQTVALSPPFKTAVAVEGIADPLGDPRVPVLLRRAFLYKRVPGLLLMAPNWRLSAIEGEAAYLRLPDNELRESRLTFTHAYLAQLEAQRLPLVDAFPRRASAAS